ncbi:MAG: hypothetical protein AAGJ87_06045 [Pseudomonadota bacterium]
MRVNLCLAIALSAIVVTGCSTLQRLAPPGFVKYEDLAKDTPPNPAIEAAVEERTVSRKTRFPRLSEEPNRAPTALSAASRANETVDLLEKRDALQRELDAIRAVADADQAKRASELEAARDALDQAIKRERDRAADDARSRPKN